MKLTPLDIRKQEFKKVMRGYDPVEVDTFMEMMVHEFEELLKQQKETRDSVIELETQLKDYRLLEKSLQQTLMQAQEATGRTYEAARKESEVLIREAEVKAARIVEQSNADLNRLNNEITRLKAKKESLIGRLRVLLSSELELIRTLDVGSDAFLSSPSSEGTGKESIELEEVLKNLNDDPASKAD